MTEHLPELDRETAERLLDGEGATAGASASRLSHMLRAAAVPGRPHELSGVDAAVIAFRAARAKRPARRTWRGLLAVIIAALAVLGGGYAFASTTGIIPAPFNFVPQPELPANPPGASPSRPSAGTTKPVPPSPGPSPEVIAPQALRGLCQAFMNKPPAERGKALESPAFADLVEAAGGADGVEAYCTEVQNQVPDRSHPPKPSKSR